MRGTARATAAITVVNALTTGIGAAVGIDLDVEATVDVSPPMGASRGLEIDHHCLATPLTRESVAAALRAFDSDTGRGVTLSLRSRIPAGRGLKSSSAVSCAIALAVARALGRSASASEVARVSAEASVRAGVSATGAFDDALASLVGGIVVTDNDRFRLLRHLPMPEGLGVALFVPRVLHPPSPGFLERFRSEAPEGSSAAELAQNGRWQEAMTENSILVERVMGYRYEALRERVRARGAVAQGVSGMGPSYAVVAAEGDLARIGATFPRAPARRFRLGFSRGPLSRPVPEEA